MTTFELRPDAGRTWPSATWPRAPGTTARSGEFLRDALLEDPTRRFRIWSPTHPYLGTVGEVYEESLRVAGGLRALGLGPGDVVAFQLPNWVEAAITFYACAMLGVTLVPIVHFYGPKEVGFILRQSGARALVIVARDRPARLPGRAGDHARRADEPGARRGGGRHRRTRRATSASTSCAARSPIERAGARGPGRRGGHRLHVGHHGGPQGGRAHAPHPGLRGPAAVRPPGRARPARPGGRAGRPRHRDAGRTALPARRRAAHLHDRRLGPAHGARRDGGGADRRRERLHLLLHQPAGLPRIRPRARGADALRRAGRVAHPERGGRAGGRARDLAGALLRVARSTRR